jgi:hypothetical protein
MYFKNDKQKKRIETHHRKKFKSYYANYIKNNISDSVKTARMKTNPTKNNS